MLADGVARASKGSGQIVYFISDSGADYQNNSSKQNQQKNK